MKIDPIIIPVQLRISLRLWDAIKLRIAGKYVAQVVADRWTQHVETLMVDASAESKRTMEKVAPLQGTR